MNIACKCQFVKWVAEELIKSIQWAGYLCRIPESIPQKRIWLGISTSPITSAGCIDNQHRFSIVSYPLEHLYQKFSQQHEWSLPGTPLQEVCWLHHMLKSSDPLHHMELQQCDSLPIEHFLCQNWYTYFANKKFSSIC